MTSASKPKAPPPLHVLGPEGAYVCGEAYDKDKLSTQDVTKGTCRACLARLRKYPQIANAINAALRAAAEQSAAEAEGDAAADRKQDEADERRGV